MNENDKKNEEHKKIKNDFRFMPNSTYWIAATLQQTALDIRPKIVKNTPSLMKNGAYFIDAGYKTMNEYLDKNPNNFPVNEIYNVYEQVMRSGDKPLFMPKYSGNPGRNINSNSNTTMNGFDVDLTAETQNYNQEKSTNAKILQLTEELAEAKYNLKIKESELDAKKRELELKDNEIDSYKQRITQNSSSEMASGLVQFYKDECERLRIEVSTLKTQYNEAQQTIIDERAKSTENTIKIAALQKEKDDLEEKLLELEGELDETTTTLNGLEQESNKGIFDKLLEGAAANPGVVTELSNTISTLGKGLFDIINRALPNGGEPLALVQAKDLPRNNSEQPTQPTQPVNYTNEQLPSPAPMPIPEPMPQPINNSSLKPNLNFSQINNNRMVNHGR